MQKSLFFIVLLCVCMTVQARKKVNHASDGEGGRPKVALVLGGGGAKGASAVGVLKYVEKSGVPIDMVVGTSIGSIVGGLYAMGQTSEQLDSLLRTRAWADLFTGSLMGILPHSVSLSYGVTKAAVLALAKNLVKFFEDTDTTVNAIAPGFVETEWQKNKPQEIRNNIYNKTAIKRFADPKEIADAVRFCINNAFVNGSIIEVSGGYCFK